MTAVTKVKPLTFKRVTHKRSKKFMRHHADRYGRLSRTSWRCPKGIDNPVRRRYRGMLPLANVGYGTKVEDRHVCPDGFVHFRVFNVKELEALMMQNRKYAALIAHTVSARARKEIIARADGLGIKVVNRAGRLRSEESE
ncbi:60S large subunit ribosomal protein eL32 (rpL32) [Andalucia godoyi]|uniref:60S large subunit ribosomal protein eL32 (RpL32) n=1 Tax=Andalucia godoyi TaxID=505711 RepID=A0A8K0AIT0_ANDGO|nr:60S large subunit ribosomal protein eL32 (rpL32) [Andalucia godoyi]WCZ58595.1 60S ribosomal protein L32 [Andalucia godoyi]|eukprot:ANDGO_01469.mRNA.1 60S large subunit ribosomal protein eL32 (rpL32)